MSSPRLNKYRAAIEVLQKGRDRLVDELADTVLDQADDLIDGGFLFHEFLENQGTRLHFLCLILGQLEQSAETFGEPAAPPPPALEAQPEEVPAQPRKRRASSRPRARGGKKISSQSSPEKSPDDA